MNFEEDNYHLETQWDISEQFLKYFYLLLSIPMF